MCRHAPFFQIHGNTSVILSWFAFLLGSLPLFSFFIHFVHSKSILSPPHGGMPHLRRAFIDWFRELLPSIIGRSTFSLFPRHPVRLGASFVGVNPGSQTLGHLVWISTRGRSSILYAVFKCRTYWSSFQNKHCTTSKSVQSALKVCIDLNSYFRCILAWFNESY